MEKKKKKIARNENEKAWSAWEKKDECLSASQNAACGGEYFQNSSGALNVLGIAFYFLQAAKVYSWFAFYSQHKKITASLQK